MTGILNAVGNELRRNAHRLALLDAARPGFDADARQQRGARLLRQGLGGADARRGGRDIGRPREPFGDQGIELRIAPRPPPALGRPVADRPREAGPRGERIGSGRHRLGSEVGRGTAREEAQQGGCRKNEARHGVQRY